MSFVAVVAEFALGAGGRLAAGSKLEEIVDGAGEVCFKLGSVGAEGEDLTELGGRANVLARH